MFRKTFIAVATVAAMSAGSLVPAIAAGANLAGGAAAAQADTSPVVQVRDRYDRGDRYDHDRGRDYRHRGNHHRGHGYQRGHRRGQICQVRPTRVVQWTPRGKIVRVIPQQTCFYGGGRHWR